MLKKSIVLFLFASLCLTQAFFFRPEPASANAEMTELVAMLPDSDVALMFDVERTLTVAAPEMLNNDAKKIENLKKLLNSIENQIGISPEEIRHIALGLKFSLASKFPNNLEDFLSQTQFTAIVRTKNSNQAFFDSWTKRLDQIMAFKEEQAPAQKYMNAFKAFRDFKLTAASPERFADTTTGYQALFAKTQGIEKILNGLPKTPTDQKAAVEIRQKNRALTTDINEYLKILKTDTDQKSLSDASIKLVNRYNNVTLDDPQRVAKLNQILKESKDLYPAFRKKYEIRRKLESQFMLSGDTIDLMGANMFVKIDEQLDAIDSAFSNLSAARLKRAAEFKEIVILYDNLTAEINEKLKSFDSMYEADVYSPENMNQTKPVEAIDTKPKSINETFNTAKRETTVNNKKMLVIDFNKFDEPEKPATTDAKSETDAVATAPTEPAKKKADMPNFGIGFVDDRTIVIGLETNVNQFLQRDAGYKNDKAVEMLASSKNPLVAFAVNSIVAKALSNSVPPSGQANIPAPISVPNSMFNKLFRDVNFYGSINYDGASVTNDVTMSLGMFKDQTGDIISVPAEAENSGDAADKTFQFGDSLISSSIFYDLLNSFKAVQASLTFKFDKKKIARLVRHTPRIIDGMISNGSDKKALAADKQAKTGARKSSKLETIEDLLTAPEVYLNLVKLLGKQES